MSRALAVRTLSAALAALPMLAFTAVSVRAQAWLPAQGEGSVSLVVQDMYSKYHFLPTTGFDRGHVQSENVTVDVAYGLTDKIAVNIGIPWVASKYTGTSPHPLVDSSGPVPVLYGVNPLDDGKYHETFQDFRFALRYNVTRRGMVLTPFVGSIMPSHDYTSFAHAAPGRDLKELQLGVSAARLLDSLVPGLFVQGTYSYGVTEQVLDISHNRSNMALELGYFVTPRLRLLALNTGQITHGGIDLTLNSRADLGPLLFSHHDQINRENYMNVGGGASYALTEAVDLFGSVIHTVAERNGHALEYGLTAGLSWSFSTGRSKARAIASTENSLVRCVCEKGTK
jgi:hypothetical protein